MMSVLNQILPPFPFPEKWNHVKVYQDSSGDKIWSVPSAPTVVGFEIPCDALCVEKPAAAAPENEEESVHTTTALCTNVVNEEEAHKNDQSEYQLYEEECEQLQLSEEWASRFSKTLKRKRRKAHRDANK